MKSVDANGVQLEYEIAGSGEPVLLIDPVIPGGSLPLTREPALSGRHQLISYHKRGWVGSTHADGPVSFSDHAGDAAALLEELGITRAHVVGHSTGAAIAIELALERPDLVQSLVLLELSLLTRPSGQEFLAQAGPVFDAYGSGDHERALGMFMTAVSGLEWETCRALLDARVPASVAQAVADADTFFGVELAELAVWELTPNTAAGIEQPVLSVLGSDTRPLWTDVADYLREVLPHVEELRIEGVGHLLHIQRPEPVASGIAEFLAGNSLSPPPRTAVAAHRDP